MNCGSFRGNDKRANRSARECRRAKFTRKDVFKGINLRKELVACRLIISEVGLRIRCDSGRLT